MKGHRCFQFFQGRVNCSAWKGSTQSFNKQPSGSRGSNSALPDHKGNFLDPWAMNMATRQNLYLERFAQDNGTCWYLAVLQRPNFKDFFCSLVASVSTGSALGSYSPLKLWTVTQTLTIKKSTNLRHCVYLALCVSATPPGSQPRGKEGPPNSSQSQKQRPVLRKLPLSLIKLYPASLHQVLLVAN